VEQPISEQERNEAMGPMRVCARKQDELQLLAEFAVFAMAQECLLAEGQATMLVKRVALLGFVRIEQALEWFWPDEVPLIGKRRLRNLLNRINQQTSGVLVRRNGGLALNPRFGCDIAAVKADIATLEAAILGSRTPRRADAELADIERRLLGLRSTIHHILPDDRYDDVVDDARDELSRRVLVLQRALALLR
jgi:DNA-binding SARP family transcriptional activator